VPVQNTRQWKLPTYVFLRSLTYVNFYVTVEIHLNVRIKRLPKEYRSLLEKITYFTSLSFYFMSSSFLRNIGHHSRARPGYRVPKIPELDLIPCLRTQTDFRLNFCVPGLHNPPVRDSFDLWFVSGEFRKFEIFIRGCDTKTGSIVLALWRKEILWLYVTRWKEAQYNTVRAVEHIRAKYFTRWSWVILAIEGMIFLKILSRYLIKSSTVSCFRLSLLTMGRAILNALH